MGVSELSKLHITGLLFFFCSFQCNLNMDLTRHPFFLFRLFSAITEAIWLQSNSEWARVRE